MKDTFKDLVIVELASVLAGPAVGMFFAELGAKVVKFENINTGGDITRKWKQKNEDQACPYSAYHCSVNYGKEIIMNDLSKSEDRLVMEGWVSKADIVISNFKHASAIKFGLNYESLKKIKHDIIYAQLNGYPDSYKVAFDVVLQAETGFLSMSGTPKGETTKMPVALIDILAGHQLKEGILIALLKRHQTGQGSFVECSLYESAVASLANQATNWLMNQNIPKKMGAQHPNIAPYGEIVRSNDNKEIVLAIGTEKQFVSLCELLNMQYLLKDDAYSNNTSRVANRKSLHQLLTEKIRMLSAVSFLDACQKRKIPAGEIRNLKQVFEDATTSKMILPDLDKNGKLRKRVSTVAFSIT